jgi:hypothetical protein
VGEVGDSTEKSGESVWAQIMKYLINFLVFFFWQINISLTNFQAMLLFPESAAFWAKGYSRL